MMMRLQRPSPRASTVAVLLAAALARGQTASAVENFWFGPNLGNWSTDANWSAGSAPDVGFNEAGVINNHTTVLLASPAMSNGGGVNVGGVKLGQSASQAGALRIINGGLLNNVQGSPRPARWQSASRDRAT